MGNKLLAQIGNNVIRIWEGMSREKRESRVANRTTESIAMISITKYYDLLGQLTLHELH